MKRLIIHLYLFGILPIYAQFPLTGVDASGKNSFVTPLNAVIGTASILENPASGVALGFQLPIAGSGLAQLQAAFLFKPKFGTYAVSFNSYKSTGSYSNNYKFVMGEKFWDKLGIVLAVDAGHQVYLDRYEDKVIFMLDAGLSYSFKPGIYIAGYFRNIGVASYLNSDEQVAPGFDFRFGWRKEQQFEFVIGLDGDFHQIPCGYLSFEYFLHKLVAMDIGLQSFPFGAGLSIVVKSKYINLNIGTRFAIQRGFSPFLVGNYAW